MVYVAHSYLLIEKSRHVYDDSTLSPMEIATPYPNLEIMASDKKSYYKDFFNAVNKGHMHSIKLFIKDEVDIKYTDEYGRTALHYAHDPEVFNYLLLQGADLNAVDNRGCTVLHHVIVPETIKLLVSLGLDVNAVDKHGCTPLHYAFDTSVAKALLECGADVTISDNQGYTPIANRRKYDSDIVSEALRGYLNTK